MPKNEHFGSEPPGSGWVSAGPMRWLRGESDFPRIAIVGGGPAGLFVSWMLNDAMPDASLTIFEATDRLGGKIRTKRFRDGTPYESGVAELYEHLGKEKDPLRLLIEQELGLRTVDIGGGGVILGDYVLRDMDDVEKAFGSFTRLQIERFHERCAELMPLSAYANRWQPDNSHPWADKTFLECLMRETTDENARAYIKAAVHSDLATEAHACDGLNGIRHVLADNPKYVRLYHVVGGIQKVVRALDEAIDADVRFGARVVEIGKTDLGTYIVHFLADGRENSQEFDAVVVALPNHWLSSIQWGDPLLHDAMHRIVAHYDRPGHYLRVSMLFRSAWWKRLGMPGEFFTWDAFGGCCVYDESIRWKSKKGHVLSFLLAGNDALAMCSQDQSDRCIVQCVLDRLPSFCVEAQREFVDGAVARYCGNAQGGGWPAEELRGLHQPEPQEHPGVFLACDAFFDGTLNGCLMSAATALDLLCNHFGVSAESESDVIAELEPSEPL
jgi:monoamine oxidase